MVKFVNLPKPDMFVQHKKPWNEWASQLVQRLREQPSDDPSDIQSGPFSDLHEGSNITKIADRLFVGAAVTDDGSVTDTTNATFLGKSLVSGGMNSYWAERNATLLSVSGYGGGAAVFASRSSDEYTYLGVTTIWAAGQTVAVGDKRGYSQRIYTAVSAGVTGATPPTHTTGTVSDGTVDWTFTEHTYTTPIGMSAFVLQDVRDGSSAWASYFEAMRASGAGTVFAQEIDVKNFGSNVTSNPYNHLPVGSTIGIWLAAGGDTTLGAPANPSTAAITIGPNATTWNTGIVIAASGLTVGGSGLSNAIALPINSLIGFYESFGNLVGNIRSENTDPSKSSSMVLVANAVEFITRSSLAFLIQSQTGAADPANFLQVNATAAGSGPSLNAKGTDTNIDLPINPKGTGLVRFGAKTAKAAEAFSDYFLHKMADGTTVKVMICS